MFKKISCPQCHQAIDEKDNVCPFCDYKIRNSKDKSIYISFVKQIIVFIIGFACFQLVGFIISALISLIANQFSLDPSFVDGVKNNAFTNFFTYGLLFYVMLFVLWNDNFKIIKSFKGIKPILLGIAGYAAIYAFNILYSNFLVLIGIEFGNSGNESSLREIVKIYPIISLVIFGIVGPFVEEITYRIGLFSFFKRINRILAYVVTIIIFTLIHFTFKEETIFNELLNVPYYAFAAITFCFLYDKFGFASSMYAHAFNNIIDIITVIIINNMA